MKLHTHYYTFYFNLTGMENCFRYASLWNIISSFKIRLLSSDIDRCHWKHTSKSPITLQGNLMRFHIEQDCYTNLWQNTWHSNNWNSVSIKIHRRYSFKTPTKMLQIGALWDTGLVHCRTCATGLLDPFSHTCQGSFTAIRQNRTKQIETKSWEINDNIIELILANTTRLGCCTFWAKMLSNDMIL